MTALNSQEGGTFQASPDTCMTPGVSAGAPGPMVYPNIAQGSQAIPGTSSTKVVAGNMPAFSLKTQISMSSGDEAGNSPGGVASGIFKGPAKFTMGSMSVMIENQPATTMTHPTGQNGPTPNAVGCGVAPSQTTVMVNG